MSMRVWPVSRRWRSGGCGRSGQPIPNPSTPAEPWTEEVEGREVVAEKEGQEGGGAEAEAVTGGGGAGERGGGAKLIAGRHAWLGKREVVPEGGRTRTHHTQREAVSRQVRRVTMREVPQRLASPSEETP